MKEYEGQEVHTSISRLLLPRHLQGILHNVQHLDVSSEVMEH